MDTTPDRLSVRHLSLSFGANRVLDDVDLSVAAGSVLALVGQNGSGKSSLVKVLAGHYEAGDGAEIRIDGDDVLAAGQYTTAKAFEAGFRFIHQNLNLVPTLTGLENVSLRTGWVTSAMGRIDWRASRRRIQDWCRATLGRAVELDVPVERMTRLDQLMIALARALFDSHDAKVLVLDEATVGLPAQQWTMMRDLIAGVREAGLATVYITHNLEEIPLVADRVVVIRDGSVVLREEIALWDEDRVVTAMAGREVQPYGEATGGTVVDSVPVLVAEHLAGSVLDDLSLTVAAGTIVGVTGTMGSGVAELGALLAAVTSRTAGEVRVGAVPVLSYRGAGELGIAYLPEDNGTIRDLTVRENLSITDFSHCWNGWFLSDARERAAARRWMEEYQIRPADPDQKLGNLSGGNRQKVALARLLRLGPRVLILEEPTQGVDAEAKQDIYGLLTACQQTGTSILVISGDYQELAILCSTVHILDAGRIARTLTDDITAPLIEDAVLTSVKTKA